jgi:hypothetical protein
MAWEGLQDHAGWLLAARIALLVSLGSVVTDFLVRRHRRRFLADLMGHLGLAGANEFSEEIDQITRVAPGYLFVMPVVLFAGITAIGLHYALLPSEKAAFLDHTIFVFSAQFGTPAQVMEYQLKAIAAMVAGFIGAYAFCLYWFYQDIRAGRFSPGSLLVASGTIVAASIATVVLWHAIAAVGAGSLVSFSTSTLFVGSVIAGAAIARPAPLLLQRVWVRLWQWDGPLRPSRTLQVIDGLDFRSRRQLALLHINDVQNLATASPLLLAAATDLGLSEIIDWIGQARMVLRVDDQAQVDGLRSRSVRTIFHLVDAARHEGTADELGRVLLDAARPPASEIKRLEAPEKPRESGGSLILRIAESERADPQFQRLEAIRSATGVAAGATSAEKGAQAPVSLEASAGFSVVRAPVLTMRRWTEHGVGETMTKLAFTVDLAGEPGEKPDSGQWTKQDVTVRLSSPAVEFEEGQEEGIVRVRRGDTSLPCHIIGTLRSDEPQIKVRALFYVDARFSGALVKTFPVAAAVGADVIVVPGPVKEQPPSVLTFSDDETDLTVTVIVDPKNPFRQSWELKSAALTRANGYMHSRQEWVNVQDPAGFFAKYRDILATENAGKLKDLLHGLGLELFLQAPACFKDAYWFLREKKRGFSIQFITDDGLTPVELMVPFRVREELDLLSAMHPMARWQLPRADGIGGDLIRRIPRGTVAAMAPDYSGRNDVDAIPNLPAIRSYYATREMRWFDGATGVLKALLRSSHEVRILVFYGHGKAGSKERDSYLVLADDTVVVREIDSAATTLGSRYQTLVVLNACSTGAGALGSVSEWPTTLMKRRFGGVVAPLWDVDPFPAHVVTTTLLDDIVQRNRRISESLHDQKAKAFADGGFPAALAYVFHGDVTARME